MVFSAQTDRNSIMEVIYWDIRDRFCLPDQKKKCHGVIDMIEWHQPPPIDISEIV
jgi:hypothetical protein